MKFQIFLALLYPLAVTSMPAPLPYCDELPAAEQPKNPAPSYPQNGSNNSGNTAEFPVCKTGFVTEVGPDGRRWGYENNKSCLIANEQGAKSVSYPICTGSEVTSTGSDSRKWGYENGQTCLFNDSVKSSPNNGYSSENNNNGNQQPGTYADTTY
ncbi:hypothetical protein BKA69DRAFT_1125038 [Paraphysoderma sedebokerense]|nr:hypothetical protein BKA69DRAFT_1125038 [Paraphysoderma sedebokerense]